jgi:iron(III) transport system ATP-binding protein
MTLNINNLSFRYFVDKPVITKLTYTFKQGHITAITGASGVGKSTLLQLILGLLKPHEGSIVLGETLLSTPNYVVPTEQRGIGAVFQDFALFPHLTVYDNLAFGLKGKKSAHHATILSLASLFQIDDILSAYPYRLSGGQMQRVAMARSFAPCPSLLLLDEPFSNLDETLTITLRKNLKTFIHDKKMTVIVVTHDRQDTRDFSDDILNLEKTL